MSDPRFARLKSDPRFRRIHQKESKVVVDERFKSVFDEGKGKKKTAGKRRVDKYGRAVSDTHEQDDLRRFYRLEDEDEDKGEEVTPKRPDYARGEALLESSDEDNEGGAGEDDESDTGGMVTLGRDIRKPISLLEEEDEEPEIDLDEDNFADLEAQAAAYAQDHAEDEEIPEVHRTRRLAVVNLDWDHVRAAHLYKIFSSYVSSTAPAAASSSASSRSKPNKSNSKSTVSRIVRGKVLSVRVFPSEFGKERLAREEKEGPPTELFNGNESEREEPGLHEDYDENALRKYQLDRLRYYYAIVECDSVEAASHLYNELEGTELERSANVFDLSFVPDEMSFDDEFRDEATGDINAPYKPVEFVTDALRHSKVKLTWDEDDPERNQLTRRALTRKEIEENDFRAYLASSSDESDAEVADQSKSKKNKADRDKLRALLLSGGDDTLPEGWGNKEDEGVDGDMEITFTPGLSEARPSGEDETTLDKYQRKMKEKRKKRKEELKDKVHDSKPGKTQKKGVEDDFFADDGDSDGDEVEEQAHDDEEVETRSRQEKKTETTAEELALLAVSDNPNSETTHFDMKAVLKAEKSKGRKRKGKKKKGDEQAQELQEDFSMDVKDERFKAVHEDHTFAIDPSNPHFKKTKSMAALLEERSKRQRDKHHGADGPAPSKQSNGNSQSSLKSLVESVKRKSAAIEGGVGKRRKL